MKGKMIMVKQNGSISKRLAHTGEQIDGALDKLSGTGKAQKLGKRIDNVVEEVIDTLSGKGPAQKIGEKIDKAAKELKNK